MKSMSKMFLTVAVVLAFGLSAWATPVTFTPDPSASSVTVGDSAPWGDIYGTLVLNGTSFTLADGATQTLEFFTLTASGVAWDRDYTVEATLAFSTPPITGEGSGGGIFYTLGGIISAGTLTWDSSTLPDVFTLADGNKISIDFEDGWTITLCSGAMVHAYVTNLGGGAVVPEPASMLLLGFGLIGLAGARRMFKK